MHARYEELFSVWKTTNPPIKFGFAIFSCHRILFLVHFHELSIIERNTWILRWIFRHHIVRIQTNVTSLQLYLIVRIITVAVIDQSSVNHSNGREIHTMHFDLLVTHRDFDWIICEMTEFSGRMWLPLHWPFFPHLNFFPAFWISNLSNTHTRTHTHARSLAVAIEERKSYHVSLSMAMSRWKTECTQIYFKWVLKSDKPTSWPYFDS